jgi:hypothetical protein
MQMPDMLSPLLRLIGILFLAWPLSAVAHERVEVVATAWTGAYLVAQAAKAQQGTTAAKVGAAARTEPTSDNSGAVTLLNCSGRAITVKAYKADDNELVVPEQTNAIANGLALTVYCATKTCKLAIESIKTEALSGHVVYTKGKVVPSDRDTVAKGCRQFK